MTVETRSFITAYQSYYNAINNLKHGLSVLEVGGGAHPSINNREGLEYTIVDPDMVELSKAPDDIVQINCTIQDLKNDKKYDLIISKMVLEHVENPDDFHQRTLKLLTDNGKVIHFFACRHSLPALVNRLLPEQVGDSILRILKNRDLSSEPKYKAYYKRTKGHTKSQLDYLQKMGYSVQAYYSFVGHKYFRNIPILGSLERTYTSSLKLFKLKSLATVSLVILTKKKI